MSDQSSWPGGPYGVPPQPAPNPYLPPENFQNPAVPPPPPAGTAQPAWSGLNTTNTTKPHGLTKFFGEKPRLWMTAVKISAAVIVVYSFILGIFMCATVSRWTATLNGGLFATGKPNTGLAILTMFGIWILGIAGAFLIMLATEVAADIRQMRTGTGHQR